MDPIRGLLERCRKCKYYKCTCTVTHPANLVEAISSLKKFSIDDFKVSKHVLRRGNYFTERVVRYTNSKDDMVMKVCDQKQNKKAQIKKEAQVLRFLGAQCEFICSAFAIFEEVDKTYFITEYLSGGNLENLLHTKKFFGIESLRFYGIEAYMAIEFLQQQQIVHRNIQPEHFLIDSMGHIKLTGFGLSKHLRGSDFTYTMVGNPHYMAPEVLTLDGYSLACDWYSYGCLLFHLAQGFPPFSDFTVQEVIDQKSTVPPFVRKCTDARAINLIRQLLIPCPTSRAVFAAQKIKAHPLFQFYKHEKINWQKIRSMQPPFDALSTHSILPYN